MKTFMEQAIPDSGSKGRAALKGGAIEPLLYGAGG